MLWQVLKLTSYLRTGDEMKWKTRTEMAVKKLGTDSLHGRLLTAHACFRLQRPSQVDRGVYTLRLPGKLTAPPSASQGTTSHV